MKKLRMLLAALLITVFIMPYSPTRAESAETPVSMSIDIVQNSTEITVGETATASWTYTAALPIGYYSVHAAMYNEDDSTETILYTNDESIASLTFTPTQAGWISLTVTVKGADGRSFSEQAKWTVKGAASSEVSPMSIDIVQNSTEAVAGETITASWTYTAALPIGYYSVHAAMYNEDDSTETILYTNDESIASLTFTPTQAGWISLTVTVKGADGRSFSKQAKWTVKTPPPPLPGDANNDGVLNLNDAIAILLHLAGNNASISLSNADINGDGKVNSSDVLVILQRAAGWN